MKIKNKFRYIFIFGIVLALFITFSFNVFAVYISAENDINFNVNVNSARSGYYVDFYFQKLDSFTYNNNTYSDVGLYVKISYSYGDNRLDLYCLNYYYDEENESESWNADYIGSSSNIRDIVDPFVFNIYANDSSYFYYYFNGYTFINNSYSSNTHYLLKNLNSNFNICDFKNYSSMPVIVDINCFLYSDVVSSPLTKTYDVGSFYNNNILFNQIIVDGVSEDSSTFSDITSITYKNSNDNYQAVAYSNSSWTSGYNSNLQYFWNGTAPTVSSINSDLNSLITFSTSVLATDLDKSYNLEFQQNGNYYTSVRVVGSTINGTTFNSIQSINYNSDQVYINNNFVSGYSNYLGYTFTSPDSTVLSNLNSDLGGLLVFYTVQVNPTPEEKFFHDIDVSTNGILTIVYAFANNLLSNIVFITMCVALPLVSFAVVQVIRIFKIKKGQ